MNVLNSAKRSVYLAVNNDVVAVSAHGPVMIASREHPGRIGALTLEALNSGGNVTNVAPVPANLAQDEIEIRVSLCRNHDLIELSAINCDGLHDIHLIDANIDASELGANILRYSDRHHPSGLFDDYRPLDVEIIPSLID